MPTPTINNGQITVGNKAGSNITIDTRNNSVLFHDAGGATASYSLSTNSWTGTIPLGPLSFTLNTLGNNSASFSTGLISGSMLFNGAGSISQISLTYGNTYAGANIFLADVNGTWTGNAGAGFRIPTWMPGSTNFNNTLYKDVNFNPTITDPCTLMPSGYAQDACSILQNSAAYGTINVNEQKLLDEANNFTSTPESSYAYDNTIDDATFAWDTGVTERINANSMLNFDTISTAGFYDYGTYY